MAIALYENRTYPEARHGDGGLVLSALREAGMRLLNDPAVGQGGGAGKGELFPRNSSPSVAILAGF